MAKMKTYAVEVEWTERRTLFVEARKPKGAEWNVLSDEGWREATRYNDDLPYAPPKGLRVTNIRAEF